VDDRCDGGTVTKVIFLAGDRSIRTDGDAIDDLADVGICAADTAIQNTDAYRATHSRRIHSANLRVGFVVPRVFREMRDTTSPDARPVR
jgi:hypothetical protein